MNSGKTDSIIKDEYLRTQKLKAFTVVDDDTTTVSAFIGNITHIPFGINEQGVRSEEFLKNHKFDEYGAYYTSLFALRETIAFINRAKEEGIYDDMQIIIVSDHGSYTWSTCEYMKNEQKLIEKYNINVSGEACNYDSVLLIKDMGESGRMTMNDTTFLGNFDTYPIIMHNFDASIKDPREMDTTNRSIIYTTSNLSTIIRMTGSALDSSRWEVLRQDRENDGRRHRIIIY